jgi:predicted nucleic acid-binding protein
LKVYADTSFLVKLLTREQGSEAAVGEFRRLGRPALVYLPLHALETENAIRLKAYTARQSLPAGERKDAERETVAALDRLQHGLQRGFFQGATADWESALSQAREMSRQHTEKMGARSLDLLHVAVALQMRSECFLTADECQAKVATLAGLHVVLLRD